MKNLFYTILAFLLALPATSAHAVVLEGGGGGGKGIRIENPLKASSFNELLDSVLNLLVLFGIPIYALLITIAAYYFLSGGQDPQSRAKSAAIFKYATIGLVLLIFARAIVALILSSV